jgi:hypothetical protein
MSLTLAIVILAFRMEKNAVKIAYIFTGSLLGTFFLDIDYFIHTYFVEPTAQFSKMVAGYIKHRDFIGTLEYIYHHKDSIKEKSLNSGLFQIILAALTLLTVSSSRNLFFKALLLSTFLNSLYRFSEYYYSGRSNEWFWSLKLNLTKQNITIYAGVLIAVFLYCLTLF